MYIYDFGDGHGQSWDIHVYEVAERLIEKPRGKHVFIHTLVFNNGEFERMGVIREEGRIFQRRFWLEELDMDRAKKIVDEYREAKIAEMTKRLQKLEEGS